MIRRPRLLVELAVLCALIVAMAALGPFGSYAVAPGARLAHWALFLIGGYLCFRPVIAAGEALSVQSGLPRPAAIAAACLFGALPTSMIVALVSADYRWHTVSIADVAKAYPQVLIVGVTVTVVQLLVRRARSEAPVVSDRDPAGSNFSRHPGPDPECRVAEAEQGSGLPAHGRDDEVTASDHPAADASAAAGREPPFLDLLPPHLGREVMCLENEDHYIRVHTGLGNAMILMRMRDAVAQLAHVEGERVHRGWWVSRRAVAGVVREERSVRLKLLDGREVPVARSAVPLLRDKGWLAGVPADR